MCKTHKKKLNYLIIKLYFSRLLPLKLLYCANFKLCVITHCFHSGQEEEMMRVLVDWGPLAVTVDAVSWQDYLGGIIQYHCSSGKANHAVLITGFDRTGMFTSTELLSFVFSSLQLASCEAGY